MFNSANQTATVSVNYKKTFFEKNELTGTYDPKLVDYPFAADCPVICIGGGTSALTFPIAAGDDCLLFFNDRDLDNWFQGSSTSGNATARLHSFSDGIALVGLRSLNNVLVNYDAVRAVLRAGLTSRIAVASDHAALENDTSGAKVKTSALVNISTTAAGTLGTQLQNLITQLTTLITAIEAITVSGVTPGVGVSGPIVNIATFPPIAASLTTIATTLTGLLE